MLYVAARRPDRMMRLAVLYVKAFIAPESMSDAHSAKASIIVFANRSGRCVNSSLAERSSALLTIVVAHLCMLGRNAQRA